MSGLHRQALIQEMLEANAQAGEHRRLARRVCSLGRMARAAGLDYRSYATRARALRTKALLLVKVRDMLIAVVARAEA